MVAMVTIESFSCLNVATYVAANCDGFTRSRMAAAMAARKHDVPDALSQLSVNTAPYGAGFGVTGGILSIRLCRPGTLIPLRTPGLIGRNPGSSAFVN